MVAACAAEAPDNATGAQAEADAPVREVDAIPADETAAAAVGANDDAPAVPAPPTHIPEEFWGRWGLTKADCEPGRADAKGLLRIDDNRLYFYESRAKLDRIIAYRPGRLEANFGFGGEGQEWTADQLLELNGATLRRVARGDQPVDLRYARCA